MDLLFALGLVVTVPALILVEVIIGLVLMPILPKRQTKDRTIV